MRWFDSPQCPHCGESVFDNESEFEEAITEQGDIDEPVVVNCPLCGKSFEVDPTEIMGDSED